MSTPKENQHSSAPSSNTNNSANNNGNGNGNGHGHGHGYGNTNAGSNSGGASHQANPPSYMAMMALNGNMDLGFQHSGGRHGSSSMSRGSRR